MPRFTLIEVDNFPDDEIHIFFLSTYLRRGQYRHRDNIDFASETEINEAIKDWPLPEPNITRIIVEYEIIDNSRWQINSLAVQNYLLLEQGYTPYYVYYRNPLNEALLFVQLDRAGRMNGNMLPSELLREVLRARFNMLREEQRRLDEQQLEIQNIQARLNRSEDRPIININPGQSTHTISVHQTVIEAIKKLQGRYQTMDEEKCYAELKARLVELKPTDFPDLTSLTRNALQPAINRLDTIMSAKESKSNLTVKRMLALVWTAINDTETLLVDKEVALKGLIRNLYEIQRGGNLDKHGNDDGKSDKPICLSGTINKLVDTLNAIHPDVEIIFASKESASLKLLALVREYAVNFIKNSAEKIALFEQIRRNKQTGGHPIPESVLTEIKENVEKVFKEEFADYLQNNDLENIFSSYEAVILTENNFNSINMLILCEEQVKILRKYIDELNNGLQNSEIIEEDKSNIAALSKTLNDMLDKLIEDVKQKDSVSKGDYREFKESFSRRLNENALFSYTRFEAFRQQVLMLLNRLIEILSGKRIASISSKTEFFKKKQALHFSLKENFEYVAPSPSNSLQSLG